MPVVSLNNTIDYVERQSFKGIVFDSPDDIVISGHQFAVARISNYGLCHSFDALVKFIEEKGGTVKERAVKSADYLIVTPAPVSKTHFIYKEQQDKYDKALEYRKTAAKPRIIRDIDFYIVNDMFSKLAIDDKRRVVMEYLDGNPNFTEKTAKRVIAFIASKGKDDPYLKYKGVMARAGSIPKAEEKEIKKLLIPSEDECASFGLREWRKFFSLSEQELLGEKYIKLNKCKALNPTIRIPSVIEGKPVSRIEKKAFSNTGDHVVEVIIPSSVSWLDERTFDDCAALKRVIIQNPQCRISNYCFVDCPNLKEVIVDGKNVATESKSFAGMFSYVPIERN